MEAKKFDPEALFESIDEKRQAAGLNWTQLAKQTGVSAGTIKGLLLNRAAYELDGILFLTQWLGKPVEDFLI